MWPNGGASRNLSSACEAACAFKVSFDNLLDEAARGASAARNRLSQWGWRTPRRKSAPYRPTLTPWRFMERLLPFSTGTSPVPRAFRADIAPTRVVGGLYQEYSRPPDPVALNAACEELGHNGFAGAWYVRVGSLPIAYAVEGKNRVSAYVKLGAPLGGWVGERPYPPASELEVRRYVLPPWSSLKCLNDGKEELLIFPCLSRNILEAYGVKTIWRLAPSKSNWKKLYAARRAMAREVASL